MKGDKSEDYIAGGQDTKKHEHPWQVGLVLSSRERQHPWCGGTLISSTHILTAAHCLSRYSASDIEVLLGEHNVADEESNRVKVAEIINHPDHEPHPDHDNDYAILRLEKPVSFTKKVRPACLPDDITSTYEGTLATVTGWGDGEHGTHHAILQEVDVTVMTNAKCESDWSGGITKNMLCASAPGKGKCSGDSGGPLTAPENGRQAVIGIVSFGDGCCTCDQRRPGGYARVTEQMDWILDNTAGTFSSTCKALN